jgi:hypothetical protein
MRVVTMQPDEESPDQRARATTRNQPPSQRPVNDDVGTPDLVATAREFVRREGDEL